jgi:hypothetical protein
MGGLRASQIKGAERMVFYGDGVVWDASEQKELCKFERRWTEDGKRLPGIYETDDPGIIMKLRAAGYKGEGEEPEAPKHPEIEQKNEEPEKAPKVKKPEVKVDKRPESDRQKDFFKSKDKDKDDESSKTD